MNRAGARARVPPAAAVAVAVVLELQLRAALSQTSRPALYASTDAPAAVPDDCRINLATDVVVDPSLRGCGLEGFPGTPGAYEESRAFQPCKLYDFELLVSQDFPGPATV